MADDNAGSPPVKMIQNTVAAAASAVPPALSVRSVNVVVDSHNKSPNGFPIDIIEVELYPLNQGNGDWMQWSDLLRFRVERGGADKMLAALGLKPAK